MGAELLAPSQPRCGLCRLFSPEGHPEHREAPRVGDYDYGALVRAKYDGIERRRRHRLEFSTHCSIKVRYPTEAAANKIRKRIWQPSVHTYFCRHCSGFHLGKGEKVG